jgi:hypothetical protein
MPLPSLVQPKGPHASPVAGSAGWLKKHLSQWDTGSRMARYDMLQQFAAKFNPGGDESGAGWGRHRGGRTTDGERSTLGGDGSGILGLNRGRFTPAHVLEQEFGGAASLFMMRVTAWLRTSYLMNHPIGPMLDCITPFLTSATTGGAHFLEQFLNLGGGVIALVGRGGTHSRSVSHEIGCVHTGCRPFVF